MTVFNVNQHIPCHTRIQRQLFLGATLALAFAADSGAHFGASTFPLRDPLGIVLAWSRGHAPQ